MTLWKLAVLGLFRRPGPTLGLVLGLVLAVGLLCDTLFFVDFSQRDMTRNALAPVQVDMVARATTEELHPGDLLSVLKGNPLVQQAEPVSSADFASLRGVGKSQETRAGKVFALRASYFQVFSFLPIVGGTVDAAGALLGDATATQLGLKVGDTIEIRFAAGIPTPYRVRVSGIVGMGGSDPLFYNPDPAGGEGYGVVSDVVFLPPALFERDLAPKLSVLPVTTSSVGQTGSNTVLLPVERQVHLKIQRSSLNPDPLKASKELDSVRRSLERPFPGQVRVQNNLVKKLDNAKKDILAAKMLLTFLSLPGVLLAAYLSRYATELSAEGRRREIGLMRVRGASRSHVLSFTLWTTLLVAGLGLLGGFLLGGVLLWITLGGQVFGAQNLPLMLPSVGWTVLGGLVLTFLAFFLPNLLTLQHEVQQARQHIHRETPAPLWQRMHLDFVLLGVASVVLYQTSSSGGFKPTGTEGTAVSLSFYLFMAPFLYWMGGTLLLVRMLSLLLTRGQKQLARVLRGLSGDLGGMVAHSMGKRNGRVTSVVTLTSLALSFGVALALFLSTYEVQKQGDMRFVVGSDVRVTPPASAGLNRDFTQKLEQVPGVIRATPLSRDPVALIGSEKKSVYGIDVPSFAQTAYLPDAMFENGSAKETLKALQNTPDGVLVARDQADKFDIALGDRVMMRLYNPTTAQYIQVSTHAVGMFTSLSTSSQDSDFVLNRTFMDQQRGYSGADLFLVKAPQVDQVGKSIGRLLGKTVTLKVETVHTATKIDESSLTSLNLTGLGTLERIYTALIASTSLGLFLLSVINLRNREFATLAALGASHRQLVQLVLTESNAITAFSVLAGLGLGTLMAVLFVMLLKVIFLIPPSGLTWNPLHFLTLFAWTLLGLGLGLGWVLHRLRAQKITELLREI